MKIGIIIPVWNVPIELLKRNLSMIENQIYDKEENEIQVILVIDDQKDYSDLIEQKENITLLINEVNIGESKSRNKGMYYAKKIKCDYITFIDSDDCFYSTTSLHSLILTAKETKADVIAGKILHEYEYLKFRLLIHDDLWEHGCLYSTIFLDTNKIFFPNNGHNNDIAFNFWCNSIKGVKKIIIEDIVYSYNYYSKSDNHINNNEFKGNNARQLMENYAQIFPLMKQGENYNQEQAKYHIRKWFLKYYLILSTEKITIEQWDLWRALPDFIKIFEELLQLDNFSWNEYKYIYNEISWEYHKFQLHFFSIEEFIKLIKAKYLPEIFE